MRAGEREGEREGESEGASEEGESSATLLPVLVKCCVLSRRQPRMLHNASYPLDPSFPLTLLHVLSAPLHGLANAFVFGLDRDWWSLLSPTGMQGFDHNP
ncbi:hypothetical protein EYF80_057943 [Liparis tanakae]|uniref:Uncharacterized protein n=1 Tax=Liparis tanakae TaxID=230148 RepID=A0A4Z2ESY4_9TELE|nr:hypothetical protein EYF80_057943 [Liparis tanakae]